MPVRVWPVACVAVLLTTFALGLSPFYAPKNDVTWLTDRPGLRFGGTGTALGFNVDPANSSKDDTGASLEVWLQPQRMWDSSTFLTLYSLERLREFSLRQSQTDLELQLQNGNHHRSDTIKVGVPDVFRRTTPAFITLTSNFQGTLVYIDGVSAQNALGLRLSMSDISGRVIVGDSTGHSRSWKGQFLGLAFYERALSATQVLSHYQSWTKTGQPELVRDDRGVALYLFDEHHGEGVRSQIGPGRLSIPEKYTVLEKVCFEPLWEEFELSRSYQRAVIKNIVGFIPLGFCFYRYWRVARPVKHPAIVTIALGAAVSFTIEFLQCYLPTRDSGMTDIITNTAGTSLGILLNRITFA